MLSGKSLSGNERNTAFLNLGDARFATVSALSGFDFPDDARSVASCDWDGDGRLDFWTSHRNAPRVRFFHNEHPAANWVEFRAKGDGPVNRDAIGTVVRILDDGEISQSRSLRAGSGYLSQAEKLLHFGLGTSAAPFSITVRWPDGRETSHEGVQPNRRYQLNYPDSITPVESGREAIDWSSGGSLPAGQFNQQGEWELVHRIPLPRLGIEPPGEGRFLLLNLWNPACAGCSEELASLAKDRESLAKAGIDVVVALGPGKAGASEARSSFDKARTGFQLAQLSEDNTAILRDALKMICRVDRELLLPTSFLIDERNHLAAAWLGPVGPAEAASMADRLRTTAQERWVERPPTANNFPIALALLQQNRVDDAADFVRANSSDISRHKEYPLFLTWIGDGRMAQGKAREALVFYLNALRGGTEDPVVMNNVAWQLATHPDPAIRNGAEALKWAVKAAAIQPDDPSTLDTLAAAQAETGDFQAALQTIDKAIEITTARKLTPLHPGLARARQLYSAGQPMRQ